MSSATRNVPSGLSRPGHSRGLSPSSSGTGPNTPPLKLTKQTTAYESSKELIGGQKGGASLARRSSASFNHVRTGSLVSNSPFKTGGNTSSAIHKPQLPHREPQHTHSSSTPPRSATSDRSFCSQIHGRSKSDENRPTADLGTRKPRDSKGFQALSEKEAVSKSPFVDTNNLPPGSKFTTTSRSADFATDFASSTTTSPHNLAKSAIYGSSSSDAVSILSPNHLLSSSRPLPGTPQKPPRPTSMLLPVPAPSTPLTASPVSSSPKSNLVSKRLIGPRPPENSPASDALKKQRRKTVTWDERCDVVEFDQEEEEVAESLLGSEHGDGRSEEEETEETEADQTDVREAPSEFFGPDREGGRSPSPVLSSLADSESVDKASTISAHSDDGGATPQRETIALPADDAQYREDLDASPNNASRLAEISAFLSNHESFREDSVSTHDDSFTSRPKDEPEVETSFRLSESRSPERFPRISRDAIRRQVEQQRMELVGESFASIDRARMSSDSIRDHQFPNREHSAPTSPFRASFTPSPEPKSRAEEVLGNRSDANLEDVQSALDRLMLGVEKGFEPSIMSGTSNIDDDRMSQRSGSDGDSFAPQYYGQPPEAGGRTVILDEDDSAASDLPAQRESIAMSGADTESTDGPFTPQLHETASLDASPPTKELDFSYTKPLPSPPNASTPPTVQVTLEEEGTPVAPEPTFTLSAPMPAAPRRGGTIRRHEEAIKAKRREQRVLEGRPSRRRSQSTGDLKKQLEEPERLELPHESEPDLTDAFQAEVAKMEPAKKSYMMKQRRPTIYASDSRVGHLGVTGDAHGNRAWKAVRRPSDMNEYSKQIKQLRNQEKSGAVSGKVFVKVLGIRDLGIPLPSQSTYFTCVLNNGIHFVETPVSKLEPESLIDQEFELIEHEKLEFTLTIKIRKDPHIVQILNPPTRPQYVPPRVETPTKSRGMRSFFSSPAKRSSKPVVRERETTPQPIETTDPFGKYLKKDLTIARTLVAFKDIVSHCDTKLFETSYPLIGQYVDGGECISKEIGEIVLQIFRLPPIPGVPQNDLPQSLEECQRGLRHVQWHKVVYHEGVLTQLGGDCTTWRRRNMRVMGANLIAYNDITKKPIITMNLRKVTLVEDDGKGGKEPTVITPPSEAVAQLNAPKTLRRQRSFNALAGIEHSFRVIFDGNEDDEVCFFADTAEEKQRWLQIFGALVGRIPHNPLWAEIVWQRQQEMM